MCARVGFMQLCLSRALPCLHSHLIIIIEFFSDLFTQQSYLIISSFFINPRRMREGYGTWFVVHSLTRSFVLSIELQRPSLTSETR